MSVGMHVARGYFGLGDHEVAVSVTSDHDFLLYIWARNVEVFNAGVQVSTPPSPFRSKGASGATDGLGLSVAAQSGVDLGCIGGHAGEAIQITNSGGARVTVFLTVETARGAKVKMSATPVSH
jgi:hypothetical protein